MKIFAGIVLSTAFVACASATTVNVSCTVTSNGNLIATTSSFGANTSWTIPQGNQSTASAISCGGFDSGAGDIITSATLLATFGFTNGPFGTTSGSTASETVTAGAGAFNTDTVTETLTGGNVSTGYSPAVPDTLGTVSPGTETFGTFSVSVSSTCCSAGGPVDTSGQVIVQYTYSSTTGAPEPVSMLLFGSGLLAVSLVGRKKLIRK